MTNSRKATGGAAIRATGLWPATRRDTSLGLMVPVSEWHAFGGSPHFADILEISQAAAGLGIEALWYADHFSFGAEDEARGFWDAWTLMAAIAASVPDVYLGPLVACTAYRNPGVIAKMTEMIQDISGGRFVLGLGAGWHKPEYDQFGIRFEPRVSQFDEALQIIHGLVRDGEADVHGEHYQANQAVNLPRGASGHSTPILIGSSGDRMLGLLARYGDAWNTCWYGSTEGIPEKIAKLDAACEAAGRDPDSVVRTVGVNIARDGYTGSRGNPFRGDTGETVAFLRELEGLGFRHIVLGLDPCTPRSVAAFAPVIEAFNNGH
ncbi:MAG: LLM class flavin-dependent oxidoreductase [Chloroflexota bacterium]|nr:LLM class flavin-dependent oxidoreductase [Chloroflexota bacterium]